MARRALAQAAKNFERWHENRLPKQTRAALTEGTPARGVVVAWNKEYGFLDAPGAEVFLHIRFFAAPAEAPGLKVGDVVEFMPKRSLRGWIASEARRIIA